MASYVEWNGDWSRRQAATIEDAELYLFPLKPSHPEKLSELCTLWIDGPSGGKVTAEPWAPLGGQPFVLLTAARFSKIRSDAAGEPLKGYIDELDVGFFVPVSVTVNSQSKGIFALNPYIYVDNPAGVIMGREIFGFPKIEGEVGWNPSLLEFDLRSLAFAANTTATPATQELLLSLKRSPMLSCLAPLLGGVSVVPLGSGTVSSTLEAVANAVLAALGAAGSATGFDQIRLPLLKQYRSVLPGNDACYQEVVQGTFEIESVSAFTVYPKFLFWLSPLKLKLYKHENVDIAKTLGLDDETSIERAFRLACKLRLEGKLLV
jgi:hypothetical protein